MRFTKLVLAVTCALAFGSASSEADTVSAMSGHGWPNHFDSCFGSSWALMQNNCSGSVGSQRLLIIPAQAAYWGYNSVIAKAAGNGSNGMTNCQGISAWTGSDGQSGISFTSIVSTNMATAPQWLNLGAITVWPGGTMHFECFVAQGGGRVFSVDFQ